MSSILTFLTFNIVYHSTFLPIGLSYFWHYFHSTFFSIQHYVPFSISYFQHYVYSAFCPYWRFVLSTFFTIQHFVIRHFVPFDVLSFDFFYFWRFFTSTFCRWTLQPSCGCQLLPSHAWMASGEQGTWPGKDQCQEKHQEEDVVLASPGERRAWGLAFPWGDEAAQNRIAICSLRTAQAKHLLSSQKDRQNQCRHPTCLKCPKGLAWAG